MKPSEVAPNYASLLAEMLPKYLDPRAYKVVLGSVPEITKILELKWDHSKQLLPLLFLVYYMLISCMFDDIQYSSQEMVRWDGSSHKRLQST